MPYYDKDLGLVMCESELSLEIDALDWEDTDVVARYVDVPVVIVEDDEGWTEVYDSPLRHTLHNAHVADYIEYVCNSDIPF